MGVVGVVMPAARTMPLTSGALLISANAACTVADRVAAGCLSAPISHFHCLERRLSLASLAAPPKPC